MTKNVLGVRIDDLPQKEILGKISGWLEKKESSPKLIFTPGPEFLVTAQKDQEFKEILNSSDLNVPDGFGLHLAGVVNRAPGVDLMTALCEVAAEKKWTVGLLGGREEIAAKAKKVLLEKFPNLKISFAISDEKADLIVSYYLTDRSITLSSDIFNCDILFVGLGHPKQEKFLENSKLKVQNSKLKFRVGMGVGGSFDLIAGVKKRAPVLMQKIGLEWLWRMFVDPRHVIRIMRATLLYFFFLICGY